MRVVHFRGPLFFSGNLIVMHSRFPSMVALIVIVFFGYVAGPCFASIQLVSPTSWDDVDTAPTPDPEQPQEKVLGSPMGLLGQSLPAGGSFASGAGCQCVLESQDTFALSKTMAGEVFPRANLCVVQEFVNELLKVPIAE